MFVIKCYYQRTVIIRIKIKNFILPCLRTKITILVSPITTLKKQYNFLTFNIKFEFHL